MVELTPSPQPVPSRPPIRRRASAFRQAQRAASLRRRAISIGAIVALFAAVTTGVVGTSLAAGFGSLPNADALVSAPLASDTLVYDRTGTALLADLHPPGYQHYQAPLASLGRWLPAATVAIEDSNFWNEPGVDPLSIARAGLTDVQERSLAQGGSTITQQLVKRRLVGDDQTFARKLREAALAMRISSDFSKSQILEMYLNAIAYGNTAYGAEAAARVYFHKDASQLDLARAALLAGLPQNPTLLNPLEHWPAAKERQRRVLDAMVRTRDVTEEQAERAYLEDLSPPDHLFGPSTVNLAPGFIDWLSGELAAHLGRDAVQQGGMRVVSSLDWGLQQLAQRSVTDTVEAQRSRNLTSGALVAIDPGTGQVLALVGSAGSNVPGGQYNMAVWPPRNPGSSFKVFTYAAAIDSHRYTMVTPVADVPLTVRQQGAPAYTPGNYDRQYRGLCLVQACLGNSLNVPAVEVEMATGVPAVVEQASKMGAPPYQRRGDTYIDNAEATSFGPSLTLGGYGETPLQMAAGVATLAAGGVQREPEGIVSVTSATGRRMFQAGAGGQRVLDAGTAYIVSQMLSDPANRTMVFGQNTPLSLAGHRAAAKTGTTDDFTDAWTVGYTPSLATAVWMGNADFSSMTPGSDGMYVAAPAWHEFMQSALDQLNKGDEWYPQPSDLTTQMVDGRPAYFLPGTSASTPPPPLPGSVRLGDGWSGAYGQRGIDAQAVAAGSGSRCRSWIVQGSPYWACGPGASGLPGDPGGG
jgi:membrane peptidoglycan carboxypeptidase